MDGKRLAIARKRKGLKQAEAAALIGQSQTHYSRYERDLNDPTTENFKKICLALDVSPEYLLDMVDFPAMDPYGGEPLTSDEADLLENYRKASQEGKEIIQGAAQVAAKEDGSSTRKLTHRGNQRGIA